MKRTSLLCSVVGAGLVLAVLSDSKSYGAENIWKNTGTSFIWNDFNWLSPDFWADGDDAVFGADGIGAVNVSGPVLVRNITVNSPGYSIVGGPLSFSETPSTIAANEDVTIGAIISGPNGFVLQGGSNLTLTAANNFTGGVYVKSGKLTLRSAGVNGTAAYSIDRIDGIDAGATVEIGTLNDGSDLDGGTSNIRPPDGQLQRGGSTGRLNLTGGIFDNKGDNNGINYPPPEGTGTIVNSSPYQRAVFKISKSDGGTYVFNGQIADGGLTIAKTNGGPGFQQNVDMNGGNFTMIWGGSNSFTGFIRMNSGSGNKIILTNNGTLGYPSPINCPSRQILMNSGVIDLNGTSQRVGYVYTGNDSNSKITNSALGTVSTLTVGYNCTNQVPFNGVATPRGIRSALLDNLATGGTLALTKEGPCIQPIGNYVGDGTPLPNNYHGDTTVNDGILQVLSVGGISPNSTYRLNTTRGTLNLNYDGTADVSGLVIDGVALPNGVYGSSTAPITGPGFIRVTQFRFTRVTYSPAGDSLELTWISKPGENYFVETSTDMINWALIPFEGEVASQGEVTTASISFPVRGSFYRLRK